MDAFLLEEQKGSESSKTVSDGSLFTVLTDVDCKEGVNAGDLHGGSLVRVGASARSLASDVIGSSF